mmetsp:Transcript_27415/g.85036  ORF Transcript_27415/g.85036 Transcript_27415/m.85036 type:complete len:205 (-) Transcript_27415:216-830(-)
MSSLHRSHGARGLLKHAVGVEKRVVHMKRCSNAASGRLGALSACAVSGSGDSEQTLSGLASSEHVSVRAHGLSGSVSSSTAASTCSAVTRQRKSSARSSSASRRFSSDVLTPESLAMALFLATASWCALAATTRHARYSRCSIAVVSGSPEARWKRSISTAATRPVAASNVGTRFARFSNTAATGSGAGRFEWKRVLGSGSDVS